MTEITARIAMKVHSFTEGLPLLAHQVLRAAVDCVDRDTL
jgi:hypothetical protein